MGEQGTGLMASYTIGEVEELTGVKAHILRYWEEIIPGFAPRKDLGGWRVYSQRDIDIILRLKYLVYEKKYTIEGARDRIIEEMQTVSNNAELLHDIHELRFQLTDLYLTVRKYRIKKKQENEQK
jgi:DNA-binding transcriptional MerR regulator